MNVAPADTAVLQTDALAVAPDLDGGTARAAASQPHFRVRYWPFLDGVRGLSVLLVIAVHIGMPFVPSGFFGLDMFFSLSGFLITLLLVEEWRQTGTISLRDFYLRRALRLLPALVSVVVVTVAWTAVAAPQMFADAARTAATALLYVTNFAWAYNFIGQGPLTHTWSLAVEEQFYLVWPFLLIALLRTPWSHRVRVVAVLTTACAAIALRVTWAHATQFSMRSYVGIDTRADSLLFGCAAALIIAWNVLADRPLLRHIVRAGAVVAIVFIASMVATAQTLPTYIDFDIAAVGFAVAWILFSLFYAPIGILRIVLSWPPLVWLGRRSYGIYLWHVPFVLLPLPLRVPNWFAAILSIGVAAISYAVLERPFLRMKRRRSVVAQHEVAA
jgi:peptidoglycan/LPS O-acetylase OafA/YrhL